MSRPVFVAPSRAEHDRAAELIGACRFHNGGAVLDAAEREEGLIAVRGHDQGVTLALSPGHPWYGASAEERAPIADAINATLADLPLSDLRLDPDRGRIEVVARFRAPVPAREAARRLVAVALAAHRAVAPAPVAAPAARAASLGQALTRRRGSVG